MAIRERERERDYVTMPKRVSHYCSNSMSLSLFVCVWVREREKDRERERELVNERNRKIRHFLPIRIRHD